MTFDRKTRAFYRWLWDMALVAIILSAVHVPTARAADLNQGGANASTGAVFAKVWRLSGGVTASSGTPETRRSLQLGDTVHVGDRIEPAPNGELVLLTEDQSYLAVRPGAVFIAERFSALPGGSGQASFRLLQGGLRVLTGWIAKTNPKGYRVYTPAATIGVRGTDHEAYFLTEDAGTKLAQPAGTYDKVNVGLTLLETTDGMVEIPPGKVGFVRTLPSRKSRALITLLTPYILQSVPDFFVPGRFDAELDQLADAAQHSGACPAQDVAAAWLQRLDRAMDQRDDDGVLALFAQRVDVHSHVATANGPSASLQLGRREFVDSARAALRTVTNYSQKRLSVSAYPLDAAACNRVAVTSHVLEQGLRSGQSFRFESTETYVLERMEGAWQATRAEVTQHR